MDQAGLLARVLLPTFPSCRQQDSGMELAAGIPTVVSGLSLQLREQLRYFTGFPFNARLTKNGQPETGVKIAKFRLLLWSAF
jgi:hypothetical protein